MSLLQCCNEKASLYFEVEVHRYIVVLLSIYDMQYVIRIVLLPVRSSSGCCIVRMSSIDWLIILFILIIIILVYCYTKVPYRSKLFEYYSISYQLRATTTRRGCFLNLQQCMQEHLSTYEHFQALLTKIALPRIHHTVC